ncbi:MAG TPA: hypothetical protein PL165_07530 [Methanofastidiosum sp.]|nr:hypothetical protein [Methanofastidiosum sp.]
MFSNSFESVTEEMMYDDARTGNMMLWIPSSVSEIMDKSYLIVNLLKKHGFFGNDNPPVALDEESKVWDEFLFENPDALSLWIGTCNAQLVPAYKNFLYAANHIRGASPDENRLAEEKEAIVDFLPENLSQKFDMAFMLIQGILSFLENIHAALRKEFPIEEPSDLYEEADRNLSRDKIMYKEKPYLLDLAYLHYYTSIAADKIYYMYQFLYNTLERKDN